MRVIPLFLVPVLLVACPPTLPDIEADNDGDRYTWSEDCDDNNDQINPGEVEICDGADNDCDGETDENDAIDAKGWWIDDDGDGFGDENSDPIVSCNEPTPINTYADNDDDCDDTRSEVNPTTQWSQDSDQDGYGGATVEVGCEAPLNGILSSNDCNDEDETVYPEADELCDGQDNDCSNSLPSWEIDQDADGYVSCTIDEGGWDGNQPKQGDDCDDTEYARNPGASEVCDPNDIDEDCDNFIDDDDEGLLQNNKPLWFRDQDEDNFGDATHGGNRMCDPPANVPMVQDNLDCDDSDATINPDADEVCDTVDNNCDDLIDDASAIDLTTWYIDIDSDGFGDSATVRFDCEQPFSYVANDLDCDDNEASTYPGADEYCDSVDNDCNGVTDEDAAVDVITWYADADGDGFGDAANSDVDCHQPTGYVDNDDDCDDGDASSGSSTTFYTDTDGDGYGDDSSSFDSCTSPTGYTEIGGDCDDSDEDISPEAFDTPWDGVDNNCDGATDCDDPLFDSSESAYYYDPLCDTAAGTGTSGTNTTPGYDLADLSSGGNFSCWLEDAGSGEGPVSCWGDDASNQVTGASSQDFQEISAGSIHACGLNTSNVLECWGDDGWGQATGNTNITFSSIQAGSAHTCGLKWSSSRPLCWGDNSFGQTSVPSILLQSGTQVYFVTLLSAGAHHTCAFAENMSGYKMACWGLDNEDQVSGAPHLSGWSTSYIALSSGAYHTCGVTDSGAVNCWGSDEYGQVSDAPTGPGWESVSSGAYHSCATKESSGTHTLSCWGRTNDDGGEGQVDDAPYSQTTGNDAIELLASGGEHTCSFTADEELVCWGYNDYGQCDGP